MSSNDTENVDPSPSSKRMRLNPTMSDEFTPNENAKMLSRLPPAQKTRSPLSAVPENLDTDHVEAKPAAAKVSLVNDPNYFLYRKAIVEYTGDNQFDRLSDEMILQILKFLPKKTLMRLCLVCERFHRIVYTDVLWTRLDLAGKCLKPGAVGNVITRGVVILRLAQSELPDPIFSDLPSYADWNTFESKLQFLDLSMCTISPASLQKLLSMCRKLRKLSLEHVPVTDGVLEEIAENHELESLNLAMCEGIHPDALAVMLTGLTELKNLNISWTFMVTEAVSILVKKITPTIVRLNAAGCKKTFTDNHLKILVKRCTKLIELDLSDCVELTAKGVEALNALSLIEYLSLSRCYNIDVNTFLVNQNLPSLRFLDVFGLMKDEVLELIAKSFPSIGFNKYIHSSVARPTVGTRRTSIWGLRTRDY